MAWINAMTAELFIMTTFRNGAINVADGLSGEGMVKKGAGSSGTGEGRDGAPRYTPNTPPIHPSYFPNTSLIHP